MGILYGIVVIMTLIIKIDLGKYFLPFFAIFCVADFVISRMSRPWLIVTVTGLLLSYELLEFSFRHDILTGDEELHKKLIRNHAFYLVGIFSVILGASLGGLYVFERTAVLFSESFYMNALIFSSIFFAVLYILRYVSK
jgi:uncharacterized protein involved in response to NO